MYAAAALRRRMAADPGGQQQPPQQQEVAVAAGLGFAKGECFQSGLLQVRPSRPRFPILCFFSLFHIVLRRTGWSGHGEEQRHRGGRRRLVCASPSTAQQQAVF